MTTETANALNTCATGELIDELLYRALMRGEPYIRLYANDLVKQLNEMKVNNQ